MQHCLCATCMAQLPDPFAIGTEFCMPIGRQIGSHLHPLVLKDLTILLLATARCSVCPNAGPANDFEWSGWHVASGRQQSDAHEAQPAWHPAAVLNCQSVDHPCQMSMPQPDHKQCRKW